MKKIKKKRKKKNNNNHFIKILKNYQIIILYLNLGLTFFAIVLSIWNTLLIKENNSFHQNEVAPAFQINTYENDNEIIDELVNLKGFINNVSFTRYDEITILSPYLDFNATINCSHFLESNPEEKKWLIDWSCSNDYGKKVARKVYELAKEKNIALYNAYSFTYYKVEYQDFKNEFHSEVYYKNSNNVLQLQTNMKEYKFSIYTGMPKMSREHNDRQIDWYTEYILEYLENYKNVYDNY